MGGFLGRREVAPGPGEFAKALGGVDGTPLSSRRGGEGSTVRNISLQE